MASEDAPPGQTHLNNQDNQCIGSPPDGIQVFSFEKGKRLIKDESSLREVKICEQVKERISPTSHSTLHCPPEGPLVFSEKKKKKKKKTWEEEGGASIRRHKDAVSSRLEEMERNCLVKHEPGFGEPSANFQKKEGEKSRRKEKTAFAGGTKYHFSWESS